MKLQSLQQLFILEIQDLYSAEEQILKALPKMAEKANSPELQSAFSQHLQQTRGQMARLDRIFDQISDVKRDGKKCKGIEGILKEGEDVLKADSEPEVRDAGLIGAAQHVEHYEIAGYGCARTYAQLLGKTDWARLLQETLDEEKQTDQKLNALAEEINVEAKVA
jgi:ferritin-like metal-binding protein YciE